MSIHQSDGVGPREDAVANLPADGQSDLSQIDEAFDKPYDLSAQDGLPNHAAPGTRIMSGRYPIISGLEHDEFGHPTASPKLHAQMSAKRRKKLQALGESLPTPEIYGPAQGNVLLVSWGSSKGPVREAINRARVSGEIYSAIHLKHLFPLPPGLDKIFANFNHVLVVELNDEGLYGYGQFAGLLRARYCLSKIRGINKVEGLNWKVREILERVKATVTAESVKN